MPDVTRAELRLLMGELGPASRHIDRLIRGTIHPGLGVYGEIQASINRALTRIEAILESDEEKK